MHENKEGYVRIFDGWLFGYEKVKLTGVCKRIEGGPYKNQLLYQARRQIFGIPLWCYWINSNDLFFFDKQKETICDCREDKR